MTTVNSGPAQRTCGTWPRRARLLAASQILRKTLAAMAAGATSRGHTCSPSSARETKTFPGLCPPGAGAADEANCRIQSWSSCMSSQSSTQPVIRDQQRQSIAATEPPQPARMQVTKMLTTKEAAALLGRPSSTLERWRCEGRGPDYVKEEGGVRYHQEHLREYIRRNTRTSSVRALVETKRGPF